MRLYTQVIFANSMVQIATLMCTPFALFLSTLSLCASVAISLSGFWAQKYLSATTYIVFINSCKIPAIVISVLIGQDGCINCDFFRSAGILIWSVGSFRYLYLTIEVGEGLSSDALLQFLKFRGKSKSFPAKYAKVVFSVLLIIALLYIICASNTLSRKYGGTTVEGHNSLNFMNSTLSGLYESVAGPDPRILTGLPVGGHHGNRAFCSRPIQFEPSDVTHSLFDAAVKVSPGFQFVLSISNATLKSWRDCSVEALKKARSYYAQAGGGILPENIYTRPYDSCPQLHKAVAPVILSAIQSITKILRFFGHNALIKQQYCYEAAGRPHVNPSEKLIEWRTFMKRHDNSRAVAPAIYTSVKRGYVFSGSSTQNLLMARSIVDVLRSHGSVLPAEFWIDPVDADTPHISPDECRLASVFSGLQCRYMCEISEVQLYFPLCHPNWRYSPYQSKLIAIKYSSFEQVFFLDNDIVPLKSMDYMFSTSQFIKYGAIFWAEFLPEQPSFPWVHEVAEAIGLNWSFPLQDQLKHYVSPLCSAQIMIDKGKFWRELSLAMYLNLDTTFFYRVMHGDKDIFAAAWMVSPIINFCARLRCNEFDQLHEPFPTPFCLIIVFCRLLAPDGISFRHLEPSDTPAKCEKAARVLQVCSSSDQIRGYAEQNGCAMILKGSPCLRITLKT
jgi:hypothetical protein